MNQNVGLEIANIWEEKVSTDTFKGDELFKMLNVGPKGKPLTERQRRNQRIRMARSNRNWRRRMARARQKFLGTIVAVQDSHGDDILIYKDGRRAKVTDVQWLRKGDD